MGVDPHDREAVRTRPRECSLRRAIVELKPELGVDLPRADEGVGVGLDPRHDAEPESPTAETKTRDALELLVGVDNDSADPNLVGEQELIDALVIAMEYDTLRRHAASTSRLELPGRGSVPPEPGVGDDAGHRHRRERLRRIGHLQRTQPRPQLVDACSYLVLVVDEQRRAEAIGQLVHADALDRQLAARADARPTRPQAHWERTEALTHAYISSTARTPIKASVRAST